MRISRRWGRRERGATEPVDTVEVFGMGGRRLRFDRTTFLVPDYAAHVPVARRISSGHVVSPRLHRLVADVMAAMPGSMVHAGTFFGDMLSSFSRKTHGTVHAFEPVLENFLFAQAVVDENHLDNVRLIRAGLAADPGLARIETSHATGRHRGGAAFVIDTTHARPPVRTQRIPLVTIDQLGITDLSLIQLDIEGFERHALTGAETTIAAQRPVIVVEDKADRCVEQLQAWDYLAVGRIGADHVYVPAERHDALRTRLRLMST